MAYSHSSPTAVQTGFGIFLSIPLLSVPLKRSNADEPPAEMSEVPTSVSRAMISLTPISRSTHWGPSLEVLVVGASSSMLGTGGREDDA